MPSNKKSNKKSHKKGHTQFNKYTRNPITNFYPTAQLRQKTTQLKTPQLKSTQLQTPIGIRKNMRKRSIKRKNKKLLKKTKKETIKILSDTLKPLIDINPIIQASTQEIQQILVEQPVDESKVAQLDEKLKSVNVMVTQAIETIQAAQAQPINPAIVNLSESLQIYIQCHGGCLTQNFGVPSNLRLLKKNDCSIGYENVHLLDDTHLSNYKKQFEDTISSSTCDITSCYPIPDDIIKLHHDAINYSDMQILLEEERKRKSIPYSNSYLSAEHNIKFLNNQKQKIIDTLKNTQSDFCRYKIDIKVMIERVFEMVHHQFIYEVNSGIFLKIPRFSQKLYNLFLPSDIHEINSLLGRDISHHFNVGGNIIEYTFTDGTKKMAYNKIFLESVLRTCADIAHYVYSDINPLPVLMLDHSCLVFDKTVKKQTIDEYKMRGLHDSTFFYGGR